MVDGTAPKTEWKESANAPGCDGDGVEYETVEAMWKFELQPEVSAFVNERKGTS